MATMRPVGGYVEIVVHAVLIGVTCWNDPSLNHSIITGGANLRFSGTTTSSEDDRSYNIEMATKSEPDEAKDEPVVTKPNGKPIEA